MSALATPSVIIASPFSSVALESSGSRVAVQCWPRPLAPDGRTGAVGERPWRLRRNTGLGGASWAAIMCPSCCTVSRSSSPSRTSTAAPGIAGAFRTWQQLQGMALELHGVVPGHSSAVFEAQDLLQVQIRRQGSECRIRARGGNSETLVVSRQGQLLQYSLRLLHGGCSGQPEFRDEPVLEDSSGTFHPSFGLGRKDEYHLDTQFCHGLSELGRRSGRPGSGRVLEDGVAVGIEGEGDAAAPEQVLHQQEVVVAVFLLAKQGVDHGAGGVVHRQQQRERWAVVSQPPVITAVQLDQHARSGHPLATDPVLGWTATARTAQPGVQQNASQGGSADVDAFPLAQQFAQMGMVDSLVSSAGQMHHGRRSPPRAWR